MSGKILSNFDPAALETYTGFYQALKHAIDLNEERCIPAQVEKVYDDGIVMVRPITDISYRTDNGIIEKKRPSFDVRPIQIIQGGFAFHIPIYVGDTGWVIAGDRDAKDATNADGEIIQDDLHEEELKKRTHACTSYELLKYQFGFFIPSSWNTDKPMSDDLKDALCLFATDAEHHSKGGLQINRDGSIILGSHNGVTLETRNDKGEYGDFSIFANVNIEGDSFTVVPDSVFKKNVTILGDVDIGENDHASLKDTKSVVYNEEDKKFHEWTGKVVRTEGEFGPEFKNGGSETTSYPFHFNVDIHDGKAYFSEGIVQVGGISYYVGEHELECDETSAYYVCVKVNLKNNTTEIYAEPSFGNINEAQKDMSYYIFPIYRILEGKVEVDYRPMPNAGCWEEV